MGTEKKRTDADRRARQCERLSRLLRILKLIMGPGRWDAEALARELECSRRTVYRDLQTLSMAGVPWQYDDNLQAYRVLPGFKFPALPGSPSSDALQSLTADLLSTARTLLRSGEEFLKSLRQFCEVLDGPVQAGHKQSESGRLEN